MPGRGRCLIYRTVVFDLDGTLLDTLRDLAAAGNRLCAARGWPQHPADAYRHFVGNGIPKLVERLAPPAQRTPAVLAEALAQFGREYRAHMCDATVPYAGIPQMLDRLAGAGVRLAVYSNKDDAFARSLLDGIFGPGRFAAVHGARPGTPLKPDPQGVLALLAELGADGRDTLFVGDSDVDMLTAHNAGLACCGVLWGFRGKAELAAAGADHLAADPAALARVILQQEG